MKVNRTNYEVWMIDFFDGKLNSVETTELMAFIEANPDIKSEFEAFENTEIEPDTNTFEKKDELKKDAVVATENINEDNYEEYFIAYYEGDLSENQKEELLAFVALNPVFENEFAFHSHLIITEKSIAVFENKDSLKKKAVIGIYWRIAGVAAVFLFLFGIGSLIDFGNPNNNPETIRLASVNELSSRTVDIDLKSTIAVDIIEKKIQFTDIELMTEAEDYYELIAINSVQPQSPNITLIDTRNFAKPLKYEANDFDLTNAIAQADEPKRKSAFGRVIQNMARRVSGSLPESEVEEKDNDPKFVKALGRSISVFNTVTGSDTELVKSYDQKGNLVGYSVDGESIAWSREIASNSE